MNNKLFIVNVEAAIYKSDKWLVIKRSEKEEHAPGMLSLVGGKVENVKNESNVLEKTLKREIMEEVGIESYDEVEYVESKSFVANNGETVIDIIFLCKYKSGKPKTIDKNEVEKVFWMSKEEIIKDKYAPLYLKESIIKAEKVRLEMT